MILGTVDGLQRPPVDPARRHKHSYYGVKGFKQLPGVEVKRTSIRQLNNTFFITVIFEQVSNFRNATNHYILNGNWKIDFAGSYDFAGTSFVYERLSPLGEKAKKKKNKVINGTLEQCHFFYRCLKRLDFVLEYSFYFQLSRVNSLVSMFAPEQITAKGPTSEGIYVVVRCYLMENIKSRQGHSCTEFCLFFQRFQLLSQESNPGVEFEYSVAAGAVNETPPAGVGYEWFPDNKWTECSAPCGGGTR